MIAHAQNIAPERSKEEHHPFFMFSVEGKPPNLRDGPLEFVALSPNLFKQESKVFPQESRLQYSSLIAGKGEGREWSFTQTK